MLIHGCVIVSGLATFFGVVAYYVSEPQYTWADWHPAATLHRTLNAAVAAAGIVTFLRGVGAV